ncbi:MAG: 50S ribosomal protein L10 [Coriobacteriia bacterium]|nr:50S ribosomal protein L10 [Coriobacteriia bacterium]MBN2822571.1 50S ribosomal protein L10 [Coriobacteriia bacterium]
MPTEQKTAIVAEIKDRLEASSGIIMTDYRGMSVKDMQTLRGVLRDMDVDMKIYKNTLTQLAVRDLGMPSMDDMLVGPTAMVFLTDDPVAPAKAIMDFAKAHKGFEVKGGYIEQHVVDADSVKAIASLPSREELIAKLMGSMLNPLRGVMAMFNAPAGAFARVVKAVADQKAAA